jgi:hypothetical protein
MAPSQRKPRVRAITVAIFLLSFYPTANHFLFAELFTALAPMVVKCDIKRMSTRELIDREISELPEPLQREVYDFARFLRAKNQDESFNGLLLSETALAKAWNRPEEDAAWANL